MAYMCVLSPSRECDGCEECEDRRQDDYEDEDPFYDYADSWWEKDS